MRQRLYERRSHEPRLGHPDERRFGPGFGGGPAGVGLTGQHLATSMSVILDAGAFLALECNDQPMWRRLKAAERSGSAPMTHGGVVAQVWRGGAGRQARLAQALQAVEIIPLDDGLGRGAGVLLARSGLADAIDAALVAMADHGDQIITSDPADLAALVEASARRVDVVPI